MEEAPNARKALLENYDNLLNVADYCYNNYIQVSTYSTTTTNTSYSLVLQILLLHLHLPRFQSLC